MSSSISTACVSSTTPLNISILNKSGTCDTKCDYNFKYNSSYCSVSNKGTYISVAYDAGNAPQVTYNMRGYNVKEFRIYSPSAHTYGQDTFYNCSQTVDYIVFTPENSNISIISDTLKQMNKFITKSQIVAKAPSNTVPLFINEKGPNSSKIDDEIYIDCQPVGNSSETEKVVTSTGYAPSPINADDIFKSPWFQIIASALGFLLILIVLSKIFSSKTVSNTGIIMKPSSKMIS